MKRALIDPKICRNCDVCEVNAKCPQKAVIKEDDNDKPWIDFYKCRGCMKCKQFCEHGSILEEIKPCDGGFSQTW
jgi:flavoprotein